MTDTLLAPPRRAVGVRVPLPVDAPDLTLEVLGRPLLAITVFGLPAPQGSKSFKGMRKGKPILAEASPAVAPWRAAVAAAAIAARPAVWEVLDGPLVADMVFSMPRPANLPKTLRRLPSPYPDLDKLARAVGDALATDCAKQQRPVIEDDARIVAYRRLVKVYAGDQHDPDALPRPGAVIRVWPYPAAWLNRMEGI